MKIINNYNKSLRDTPGIYRILNLINKDCYIGSASHFKGRATTHIRQLKNGNHHSTILQRAYNKYGEDNFIIELILVCPLQYLIYYEQQLINEFSPKYNICKIAGSNKGLKWSEKSKKSLSIKRTGTIRVDLKGRKRTTFTKEKISKSRKGKCLKEDNPFYGKTHTQEVKDKIRQSKLGKKLSIETKKKMSQKRGIRVKINNTIYPSIQEAAGILNIPKSTLWRWITKNKKNYETYKEQF